MIENDDLREQMDILENVIHFVSQELRGMPRNETKASGMFQVLLDDLYEVLERHGYRGIIKLVGDVDPGSSESGSVGWAHHGEGNLYFFRN
jgi:hypothetical protein